MIRHMQMRLSCSAMLRPGLLLTLLAMAFLLFSACSEESLSIVGSPTLTAAFINQVLLDHSSPAQGTGETFYDEGLQHNIDPAFALAFFQHESDFGKRGEATESLSIGDMGCLPNYRCRDGFAWFSSWEQGIKAWYNLVSGPLYVGSGLTTLGPVIHRYSPSADGNNEYAYVESVAQSVQSWRSGQDPH
jgi:hypothetical protein